MRPPTDTRTDPPRRRFAFVRISPEHPMCRSVPRHLEKAFAEYEMEIVDVIPMLKERPIPIAVNALFMTWHYGHGLLRGSLSRWRAFFTTPYIFGRMRRLIREHMRGREYAFTFQLQSLFDASVDDTPNFVYTDHTMLANLDYPESDPWALAPRKWIQLERSIYHNARLNFTFGSNVSRSLVDQYDCDPDRVLCVGAGSNAEIPATPPANKDYGGKNVLFVGFDWERKGGPELAEAWHRVLEAHPDATLTIVGCRPEVDLDNCEIVGRCSTDEVGRYYERASIFCLPTRLEPFGIVFLEAMHYALPVVATRIGGIPDMVRHGETGFLVEPGDAPQLTAHLIRLLDDQELCHRAGEAGRRLAQTNYTWERVVTKMKTAIQEALAEDAADKVDGRRDAP